MSNEVFIALMCFVLCIWASPWGVLSCIACGFMSADRIKLPFKMTKVNPVIWCDLGLLIIAISALLFFAATQTIGFMILLLFGVVLVLYWIAVFLLAIVHPVIISGAIITTIVGIVRYFIVKKKDYEKIEWWKKYVSGCLLWDAGLLLSGITTYCLIYLLTISFN